jgi:phage replication O-like protein O
MEEQQRSSNQESRPAADADSSAAFGGSSCLIDALDEKELREKGNWHQVPNRVYDEVLLALSEGPVRILLTLIDCCYEVRNDSPRLSKEWHRTRDFRHRTGLTRRGLVDAVEKLMDADDLPGGRALVERRCEGCGREGQDSRGCDCKGYSYAYRLADAAGPAVPASKEGFTKLPRVICKLIARGLTGSELLVLLVVVRKTIGWQKKSETITHKGFRQGSTIKRSKTLSRAIRSLMDWGLLTRQKRKLGSYRFWSYRYELCPELYPSTKDREPNRSRAKSAKNRDCNREANRSGDRERNRTRKREANRNRSVSESGPPKRGYTKDSKDSSREAPSTGSGARGRGDAFSRKDDGSSAAADEELNASETNKLLSSNAGMDGCDEGKTGENFAEVTSLLQEDDIAMSSRQANQVVSEFKIDRVQEVVRMCKEKDDVRNLGGLIMSALEEGWLRNGRADKISEPKSGGGQSCGPMYEEYVPSWEKDDK